MIKLYVMRQDSDLEVPRILAAIVALRKLKLVKTSAMQVLTEHMHKVAAECYESVRDTKLWRMIVSFRAQDRQVHPDNESC